MCYVARQAQRKQLLPGGSTRRFFAQLRSVGSNYLPGSELTVFRRRKAFLLCKNPCGGTAVGMGSPPQSGIAVPAQRNFQRKFALRRVGSSKFVVPPTSSRSKVRNHARLGKSLYRAAPGCQRDRGPSVSGGVQRNPFQGVPLGNFFAAARHRASLRS